MIPASPCAHIDQEGLLLGIEHRPRGFGPGEEGKRVVLSCEVAWMLTGIP